MSTPQLLPPKKSPLLKMLEALKKTIIQEFLWILLLSAVSVPVTFIVVAFIRKRPELLSKIQLVIGEDHLFTKTYILIFAGLYFSRIVVAAIRTQAATLKKSL